MKTYELRTLKIGERLSAIKAHPRYAEIDGYVVKEWQLMCPGMPLPPHDYVFSAEAVIKRMEEDSKP